MQDRRGARWRHRAPVALGLLSLLLLAPCGGDSAPPTPAEIAAGLCGASIRWRDDLGELVEQLSRSGVGVDDVAARKALMIDFVDDAEARTAGLLDDVRDAGVTGDVEAALDEGAAQVDAQWDEARAEVATFPEDRDEESFVSRGLVLANYTERTGGAWKTAMQAARDAAGPDLVAALEAEPACSVIPRTADR